MRTITLVNLDTGELGSVLGFPHHAAAEAHLSKLPPGVSYVDGRFDRLSQRFDPITREVVEHQPEQPDVDHEWRAENPGAANRVDQRWRWFRKSVSLTEEQRQAAALNKIETLERLHQRQYISGLAAEIAKMRASVAESSQNSTVTRPVKTS